jgi:AIPR protein
MGKNDEIALQNNFENWTKNRFPNPPKDFNVWEYYCVEQFVRQFDLGDSELKSGIVGAGQDGGVDAFYILANGELVDIETEIKPKEKPEFKLVIMQVKSNEGFSPVAVDKLYWFIDDLLELSKGKNDYHSTYHTDLIALMRLFKDKFGIVVGETPPLSIECIYIIKKDVQPDGDCNKAKDRVLERFKFYFSQAEPKFTFANATAVWTQVQTRPPNKKTLKWASQPLSTQEGEMGLVTLLDYYSFISDADGRVAERFFDSNVRGYWPHSAINKGIAETLKSAQGPEFWLLNNGITILAEKSNTTSAFLELEIHDPQIVNGLQTSRQIYAHFSTPGKKDDSRRLMVRVIKISDKSTRDSIIKCTNSQNEMPPEALRTTDAIHRQLEGSFHSKGLYYDRRKGYYREKGKPVDSIISVIEVAQAMIAVALQRPDDARARPKGYLAADDKYESIFGKKSSGEDKYSLTLYIKAVEITRRVEAFLETVESELIHRRNLLFYMAMYAISELTANAHVNPSQVETLDIALLTDSFLKKPWERVRKKYENLAVSQLKKGSGEKDYDKVAKGPDLLKSIERDLRTRFAKKKNK